PHSDPGIRPNLAGLPQRGNPQYGGVITAPRNRRSRPMLQMTKSLALSLLAAIGCASLSTEASAGVDWPQFRGEGARGVADHATIPTTWSETENIRWKMPLPGKGWSSPVVSGDYVFLTAVVNEGESETPKKGLYF